MIQLPILRLVNLRESNIVFSYFTLGTVRSSKDMLQDIFRYNRQYYYRAENVWLKYINLGQDMLSRDSRAGH